MLTTFDAAGSGLSKHENDAPFSDATLWIDLLNPTADEEARVEQALGIDVPTRAEMREIEASNRLYNERGAHFMTAFVVHNLRDGLPATSALTFILAGQRLVTVRYAEPAAFPMFLQRAGTGDAPCGSAAAIMIGLVETLIHRKADVIERIQDDVDKLAQSLFGLDGQRRKTRANKLDVFLKKIGKEGDIIARVQESAASLDRTLLYFLDAARERKDDERVVTRIDTARRDIASLLENIRFLSGRTNFLLEATLGMISNEQNQIIKLFSVMAVMLMPPTLVASVYGMNFKHMPELEWAQGYPLALILMFVSGLIPFLYFRHKGWL